uniref:EF-hand domain-containing protein n=1 Tax=Myotis myotis TaxID=51298 RepID=A0A7J7SRJ4_MYOMY|nr:hypothetical protein mMyoMyo1_009432 [Myotis myotis]
MDSAPPAEEQLGRRRLPEGLAAPGPRSKRAAVGLLLLILCSGDEGAKRVKLFDKNKDGRLDLSDLARILALQENFLLQFKMDSKTGALEGPEVDAFVKDMMELVQPSVRGADLERLGESLLRHCDANRDGKIQKAELGLCLGLRSSP